MSMQSTAEPGSRNAVEHGRVLVGFDGSPASVAAVEWAAREALARNSALRIVTCWVVPPAIDYYEVGARQSDRLERLVNDVGQRHPTLVVESVVTHLDPRDALVDEAASSDVLVVGASGAGTARTMLLGTVTRTAARRSSAPVVVVRGDRVQSPREIAVAVDGSSAANAAIDWACREALFHGAAIRLVHARERGVPMADADSIVDAASKRCRDRNITSVCSEVVDGPAAVAIVEVSRRVDLVAIGSRGRSGFKTLLFGSVALSTIEEAGCPVAVTHPRVDDG